MTGPMARIVFLAALVGLACRCAQAQMWPDYPNPLFEMASGLDRPVALAHANDQSYRLFIGERPGRVRVFDALARRLDPTPFLDLSPQIAPQGARGLIGMAFHPRFASGTPHLYATYVRASDGHLVVTRFTAIGPTLDRADPSSAVNLIDIAQPYPDAPGGGIVFGADGYLYIGTGDGGGVDDPFRQAQDLTSLRGKILRLDVDVFPGPYDIPRSNPYAGSSIERPEIWAVGLHDPRALSVVDGIVIVTDAGGARRDEVDWYGVTLIRNYGWPMLEGTVCSGVAGPLACGDASLTPPLLDIASDPACPPLTFLGRGYTGIRSAGNRPWIAHGCEGRVSVVEPVPGSWPPAVAARTVFVAGFGVGALGVDEFGQAYVTDLDGGRLLLLQAFGLSPTVRMIEYHHAAFDHYFMTADGVEIAALDAGAFAGWRRTGASFDAFQRGTPTTASCRFYLPPPHGDTHFYSANPAECDAVRTGLPGAILEKPEAMYVEFPDPVSGQCPFPEHIRPLYRVWNARADTNHRYTTDRSVRDAMVAAGGIAEGFGPEAVTMCVADYVCTAPMGCTVPP